MELILRMKKRKKKKAVECTDTLVIIRGYSASKDCVVVLDGTNITSDKWICL